MLASTLAVAHSVTPRQDPNEWISWGPLHIDRPNSTVSILLMVALLLTMASVIQSLLHAFDAVVVRHRLRQYSEQHREERGLTTRALMAERHLLDGWARLESSTVQVLAYSALLVVIAGPSQIIGLAGVLFICSAIGMSYFRTARTASLEFLETQVRANEVNGERRRSSTNLVTLVLSTPTRRRHRASNGSRLIAPKTLALTLRRGKAGL